MRFSRFIGIAAFSVAPALATALVPASLLAQGASDKQFSVGVSGGASLPVGSLGDGLQTGYNLTGHVWLMPSSLKTLNFRGDVGWDSWKYKGIAGASPVDGNYRSLSVTGNAIIKVSSSSGIRPYLLAGGGLYNSKQSIAGVSGNSTSDFGVQGGGGLEFNLSGFSTFLEAKFVNVFSGNGGAYSSSNSARWVPVTFGIRF